MELKPHGENGITYSLFSELIEKNKVKEFLGYVRWKNKSFLKKLEVESVHLFPSFGRGKHGIGEPDTIIIANDSVFYVEVETDDVARLGSHFFHQFSNYLVLGESIFKSDKKKIQSRFVISDSKKFRGKYRTRKLMKELLAKKRTPYYIVISDGSPNELKTLDAQLDKKNIKVDNLGYISYRTIKRIPFITKTMEVINFNLK